MSASVFLNEWDDDTYRCRPETTIKSPHSLFLLSSNRLSSTVGCVLNYLFWTVVFLVFVQLLHLLFFYFYNQFRTHAWRLNLAIWFLLCAHACTGVDSIEAIEFVNNLNFSWILFRNLIFHCILYCFMKINDFSLFHVVVKAKIV